jgi:hypothetical protein
MFDFHGLAVEGAPSSLCFSRRLDVIMWDPERVESAE